MPVCQKSLAEFAARRPRIRFDPFFAAAPPKGTSVGRVRREKYFALASAQRNWPRQTRRLMSGQSVFVGACAHGRAGRSEVSFVKKGAAFFDKFKHALGTTPRACSCHFFSFSQITGCPAARVFGRSSTRWFRLPRNCRLMSFSAATNRPSTSTSMQESRSSVTAHRGWDPSRSSSSSSRKPVNQQMVFPGYRRRTSRRKGSRSLWFSGSKGSPPSTVSPST